MSSAKAIRQRIQNVGSTKQIMKAMDMVSYTKLQQARQRLEGARALHKETKRIVDALVTSGAAEGSIYADERPVKNTGYIIITSDKGLCGSYNINVAQKALRHMNEGNKHEHILIIGSKGYDFFLKQDKNIRERITAHSEARMYFDTLRMSELLINFYLEGKVDEVYIAYTRFDSTITYTPCVEKLLPIPKNENMQLEHIMKYEPDPVEFLDHTVPLYLHTYLFTAMSESVACEHASRMISMDAASKNADEIIEKLTHMYNKRRQAAITQELNEIIGSAKLLNQ